jgi:hypothetical protein
MPGVDIASYDQEVGGSMILRSSAWPLELSCLIEVLRFHKIRNRRYRLVTTTRPFVT